MEKILEIIKEHEGFKSKPYSLEYKTADGENVVEKFKTIGYGFRLDYLELDEEISTLILIKKIHKIEKDLDAHFKFYDQLPEGVRHGIISMVYQLGLSTFLKFKKTIALIENGEYKLAAKEALDSRWAVQTPNRAIAVTEMIKNAND